MGKSELGTRLVFGPLMLGLIALLYWADTRAFAGREGVLTAGLLGLLAVGGTWEFIAMFRRAGYAIAGRLTLALTAIVCACPFAFGWHELDRELYPLVIATIVLLFPIALGSLTQGNMARGLEMQGGSLLCFILVAWQLYFAQGMALRNLPSVLFVVLVCKGGDIGGYLVGVPLGRHKLIPHISGGKTVEGSLGSMAFSAALSALLAPALLAPGVDLGLTLSIAVGIMLNVTTQTGDLIESLLKRRCGVKDSSRMLPAHGGILDLVDSLLFSFSAFFLVLTAWT